MDTPEKTQIASPISCKFEESPVFSYINSLSPIEPVKSINTMQVPNSPSFASPPSVFTSPIISSHKETRFSKRNFLTDLSRLEFSEYENEEYPGQGMSATEIPKWSCIENSKLVVELPKPSECDYTRSDVDMLPGENPNTENSPASLIQSVIDGSKESLCSTESEIDLGKLDQIEQNKEASGCDWVKMITDVTDLLVFNPSIIEEISDEEDDNDSLQERQAVGSCKEHYRELHAPESFCSTHKDREIINTSNPEANDEDDKCIDSVCKQRSMRRLVFDLSGGNKKNSIYGNSCGSSPTVPSPRLNLNAIASTSDNIKHETLVRGRPLRRMLSSICMFDPLGHDESCQKDPIMPLNHNSAEGNLGSGSNELQVVEDATLTFGVNKEFNQNKRRKSEQAAESGDYKRCNCRKSKCLKLYCECFAAGLYCVEPCSCQDCCNKPIYEAVVLDTRKQIESRNPLAFAPKVITSFESIPEFQDESNKTSASARHKSGCNCKKSSCLKKYCECFQGGVGCSLSCRCEGCRNPFGCKYGTEETELEMEETDYCERKAVEINLQDNLVQKGEEKSDLVLPITPSYEASRSFVLFPCSFSSRARLSSLLGIESSPHIRPKSQNRLQMIPEDETPKILQENHSPTRGVNSTSPNCKRVSLPPHLTRGAFEGRSSRKLILRSIPSFPSLNQRENSHISERQS